MRLLDSKWSPIALLAILTLVCLNEVLSGQWLLLDRELDFLHYRYFEHCREYLERGTVPLWTPRVFFGFPLLANIQLALCYPPNWLAMTLLPTQSGIALLVALHLFLAAAFTYGLMRSLGCQKSGSLIAGATFVLSGFVVSKTVELMTVSTLPWLPAVLWAMDEWFRRKRPLSLALAGAAFGLQCLAGHTQYAYYTALAAGLFALFHWLSSRGRRAAALRESLTVLAVVAVLGSGLFAVQLLPTYELTRHASRAGLAFEEAAFGEGNVLTLPLLMQTLLPHFKQISFGSGLTLFVGPLWPMLATIGLVLGHRRAAGFLGLTALSASLLAAGGNLPFFQWLYDSPLPGFAMFHDPIRIMSVGTLAIAGLCGLGVDALLAERATELGNARKAFLVVSALAVILVICVEPGTPDGSPQRFLHMRDVIGFGLAISIAIAAVLIPLRYPAFGPVLLRAMLGIQVLSLLMMNNSFVPKIRRSDFEERQKWEKAVAAELHSRSVEPFRVYDMTPDPLLHNRWLNYRMDSTSGFSSLVPGRVMDFTSRGEEESPPTRQCSYSNFLTSPSFLAAANCRFIIMPREMAIVGGMMAAELRKNSDAPDPILWRVPLPPGSPWSAFEVGIPTSRARIFRDATLTATPDDSLRSLRARRDVRSLFVAQATASEVVEEGEPPRPGELEEDALQQPDTMSEDAQTIRLELGESPGWLFLSQQEFPGWRAFIDGRGVPIHRAQHLFQAVEVGRSDKVAEFIYEPRSFRLGLFLSLVSAMLLVCSATVIVVHRRYVKSDGTDAASLE